MSLPSGRLPVLVLVMLLVSVAVQSQEFIGVPLWRVVTSEEGSSEETLSDTEMRESLVVIQQTENGDYIWLTRNNTELLRNASGIYVTYLAPSGAGYVKINTLNGQFIEHVHQGLTTYTYYWIELRDE